MKNLGNGRPVVWLVAFDFAPAAEAACALALDELVHTRAGGRLVLLHVYGVPVPFAAEGIAYPGELPQLDLSLRTTAQDALAAVVEKMRARVREVKDAPPIEIVPVVMAGSPRHDIVREAVDRHADRIVVGTHGRRSVERLLLGSVAEAVVRTSPLPVLVAHAP